MLSRNLINFRRALLIGIVITTILAYTLPIWLRMISGQIAFIFFLLIVGTYIFETAFYSIGDQNE